jgi:F-type H+-transporting ATPase subunit b
MISTLLFLSEAAEGVEHAEHAEATLLGLGPEGWVYAGITLFFLIAVFGAKAHRQLLGALDAQIAETRKSLDEAAAIRGEAEALLASAKEQQAASAKEAVEILTHAQHEAETIVAKAKADTADLVARRAKMAQDKISAAERAAVEALRARTAEAATSAARGLIAAQHDAKADKGLVDEAIAGL